MASNIVFDGTKGISLPSFTTTEKNAIVSPATGATVFDTTQNRQNVYAGGVWNAGLNSGTAVASTSGTSIDFTGIPSWVKRITVMFKALSGTGTQAFGVRLGTSGGFVTTGYSGTVFNATGAASSQYSASQFIQFTISSSGTAASWDGMMTIALQSGNVWVAQSNVARGDTNGLAIGAGSIDAGGTVTQLRIMTASTDTFDAGSINILYE